MGTIRDIALRAGVVKDETELEAQPRWVDANRIRFVRGKPQPIGGWSELVSGLSFKGKCRGLLGWLANDNIARLAVATHTQLSVLVASSLTNITPIRDSGTLGADPFTTTAGSTRVNVEDTDHQQLVGDTSYFDGAAAVGGITIDGSYEVVNVVDANNYEIEHTSAATSSATGGGSSVDYEYEIHIGRESGIEGYGYGVGTWNSGTYGTARDSYIVLQPRVWSLDQWGQNLVACPRDGSIYQWTLNTSSRAAILANAPTQNTGIFVTVEKHLVALNAGGTKMRLEWCDQDDNTVWTPSDVNTAGGRNLVGGAELLFGLRTRFGNLVFSDAAVFAMTFVGGLDVFGFDTIASGASGIMGPRAACEVNGIVYWMGNDNFYMYDGNVRPIPNAKDIRRHVFDNLQRQQRGKVHVACNTMFQEIYFFYPSTASDEIDSYAKYNYEDQAWDVGSLARTAMIDIGPFPNPIGADTDGKIARHEDGYDDYGTAMGEHITSSPLPLLADGGNVIELMSIIPDMKNPGTMDVTVLTREYPNSTQEEVGFGEITDSTEKLDGQAAGRLVAVKFSTAATKTEPWRAGRFLLELEAGGNQ